MTFTIQTDPNGPDWNDDRAFQFKYRYESREGHPCAQPVFDARKQTGQYARLVGWENERPSVLEVAGTDRPQDSTR